MPRYLLISILSLAVYAQCVGGEAGLGRQLAEATASGGMPLAGAPPGSTTFTAKRATLKDGLLTLYAVSPASVAYVPGLTPIPSPTEAVISQYQPGQTVWAVLATAPGADGNPAVRVVEASDPVLRGDTLKMKVATPANPAAAPKGGAVEGALKMAPAGAPPPPPDFEGDIASLTVDNVPPEEAGAATAGPNPPATKPAAPSAPGMATTPNRRLLQKKCGVCRYANKEGICVNAPADCDGVVGQPGEWDCGMCQYFTQDDVQGHCEVAPNC